LELHWWCTGERVAGAPPSLLALIRSTVRQHAGDILVNQDPYDLYAAQDALLLNTPDDLMPEGFPDLRIALTDARVVLNKTAQALADHDEEQRRQWQRANALRAQTVALKDLLVEPGLGLAWMAKTQPDSVVNRKQGNWSGRLQGLIVCMG
jgi:hypothetical protein